MESEKKKESRGYALVFVTSFLLATVTFASIAWILGLYDCPTVPKAPMCVCESEACPAVPPVPQCSQIDCPGCPDPTEVRVPLSDELARVWDACAPGVEAAEQSYNRMLAELAVLFQRAEVLKIKFNSFEWVKSEEARDVASKIIGARDRFFELRSAVYEVVHECQRKMDLFTRSSVQYRKASEVEERITTNGDPEHDYFYDFFTGDVLDQVSCNLATGMLACQRDTPPSAE